MASRCKFKYDQLWVDSSLCPIRTPPARALFAVSFPSTVHLIVQSSCRVLAYSSPHKVINQIGVDFETRRIPSHILQFHPWFLIDDSVPCLHLPRDTRIVCALQIWNEQLEAPKILYRLSNAIAPTFNHCSFYLEGTILKARTKWCYIQQDGDFPNRWNNPL